MLKLYIALKLDKYNYNTNYSQSSFSGRSLNHFYFQANNTNYSDEVKRKQLINTSLSANKSPVHKSEPEGETK